ncbi:MAG TPA: glycosyltransferase family 2 protein [Clostridiales bacterium]|nr:glycosyltransferase family 2 protein [Clostridiales bacterium]HQP70484.1 glycosyltransferase family 2 protein [Clostridiales bacterium]
MTDDEFKVSIIINANNAEETLFRCLDAVMAIDYPKDLYEVLLIDNGSTDRTFRIASGYSIRLIGTRKRLKNSDSMMTGARHSGFENLLFLDQKTIVKKDILNKLKELNNSPLISGELNVDKYRSGHDTFMFLISSRLYSPHFPQSAYGKELWITKKNFKKVSKNKALLFISKDFFNKLHETGFDYNNGNDDLFRKIIFDHNMRILSHTEIDVEYIGELKVKTNREIVENGYRWGKRYLSNFNAFSFIYYMIHIAILVIVIMYTNIAFLVFVALYLSFLLYLSRSKKDFWILFKVAPAEIIRFYSGTIKYITNRS